MPLTAPVNPFLASLKNAVKRVLGRPVRESKRAIAEYNELLNHTYRGKEPVFDLAAIEIHSRRRDARDAGRSRNGRLFARSGVHVGRRASERKGPSGRGSRPSEVSRGAAGKGTAEVTVYPGPRSRGAIRRYSVVRLFRSRS